MKSYSDTVNWLFNQLPVYQRTGGANYKIDLTKTHQLMEVLGHPERNFKSIHVAGTNGKGSVSHMLASIFQEAGLKVGLYTSPHLRDFRERVKIGGTMIPEEDVVAFVETYRNDFERLQLSFFEMTVGLAFDYFSRQKVDLAIVEVGMGGRLDSTNVLSPLVSVITNIGLDHQQFLGNTLEEIAGEKAGIIKANTPVVIGQKQAETTTVFTETSARLNAPLVWAEEIVDKSYECELSGNYQAHNIKTAVAAVHQQNSFEVNEALIERGLKRVVTNTGLLGRWQKLSDQPLTICDTGHNAAGVTYILQQLAETPHDQLHMVWGMVNDKDISTILKMLPKEAKYYFCKPDIPRGLEANELMNSAAEIGLKGSVYTSVNDALTAAQNEANTNDVVFVGGSTFVVAEVV